MFVEQIKSFILLTDETLKDRRTINATFMEA